MTNIHKHYDQLTNHERGFVDASFTEIFHDAKIFNIPLAGDDRAERAVDALSQLILESRVFPRKPKSKFKPPVRICTPTPTEAEKAQALEDERNSFDRWVGMCRP